MDRVIKILALDDHPMFLNGFADCMRTIPFVERIDICSNYSDLLAKLNDSVPDILFTDLNMPHRSGFTICQQIKREYTNMFVAILTSYDEGIYINKAQEYGAGAYFLKSTDANVYYDFLADFREGRIKKYSVFVSPAIKCDTVLQDGFELKASLTKRERQVMKMIIDGCEHSEIEQNLGISYETYRGHRHNILTKLKIRNDVELVRFAEKHLPNID